MRHCCKFSPIDIYFLEDNNIYSKRKLYIGYCPICNKQVAELIQENFNNDLVKESASGLNANQLISEHKNEIIYSMREFNFNLFKQKPFGWKYGINKSGKINGKKVINQFACDFYGNQELVKTIKINKI